MTPRWSPFHLRLHRLLLHRPQLLPQAAPLLLAVSGGQDSIAMTGLLLDLRRLHGWRLQLWHGDHGWRPESGEQARELAAWAEDQRLTISVERWARNEAHLGMPGGAMSEAGAREWRYGCLEREARRVGATHVLTGHTASDRAETLLLHLARGSHRRGLGSLQSQRELAPGVTLVRPLLSFSRADTAAICRELDLPIWEDSSNSDPRFSRNRVRQEVMPVLEALHPGASRRLAATAERLEEESDTEVELIELALQGLVVADQATASHGTSGALNRPSLVAQSPANQRRLLQHWCRTRSGQTLAARQLELLLQRLAERQPPGAMHLAAGWQLHWDRSTLQLEQR
jgi:tRNA(Ile)-lysidine synthase